MDISGQVHQGSVFGYILVYALAPTGAHARATYLRAFALIAVQPHLYTDVVDDFDQESSVPFKALQQLYLPLVQASFRA